MSVFNDVWELKFEPRLSPLEFEWTQLPCAGNVPEHRWDHAAAVVGGWMYIFGGRSLDDDFLGDLSALDIVGRRWYAFPDTGHAPSPRSGLCMSTYGSKIYVVGGESKAEDQEEISMIYTLDTSKLKVSIIEGAGKSIEHLPPKK